MLIVAISIVASLVILCTMALALWQARKDALAAAEREGRNIVNAVVGDIRRTIGAYESVLADIAADVENPIVTDQPPLIRQMIYFDRVDLMPGMGNAIVFDATGRVVAEAQSATPRQDCCPDRSPFTVHAERPDAGLFVSRPIPEGDAGDKRIVLSRRIDGPDGRFAGVVAASLRIAYFREMFRAIDVGPGGSIGIFSPDGYVIARQPSADGAGDVLRPVPLEPDHRERFTGRVSAAIRPSPVDGVERLFTLSYVGDLPLVVVAGQSTAEIYRDWNARAMAFGGVTLLLVAVLIAFAVGLRRELIERDAAESLLAELAVTDPLTNLSNRRRFEEVLSGEWRRAVRNRTPLAVLMVDVDNFKAANDRYGHITGDAVLRSVAKVIAQTIRRPGDVAARWGGDEFVVVLPDTSAEGAQLLAERMRERATEINVGVKLRPLNVTVTIGIGCGRPTRTSDPEDLVTAADRALYEGKRAGRNRVARVDLVDGGTVVAFH